MGSIISDLFKFRLSFYTPLAAFLKQVLTAARNRGSNDRGMARQADKRQ
jgi:hypothetical protein